nr:EAL domain-containing protein [Pantoea sp. M_9]
MQPAQHNEAARLKALEQYQLMNTSSSEALDRLTMLAARLFRVPMAFISLIDSEKQFFKSRYGLTICESSRNVAFCHHTLEQDDILCVTDTLLDKRFNQNPLVLGYPHIRFYAGIPLITPEQHRIGTVCLVDSQPRPALTAVDHQHLTAIASLVMDRMEVHRLELLRHSSQQRLEAISSTSSDAIICTDIKQGVIFWNPAATRLFGYSAQEMMGEYVANLVSERSQTDYRQELARMMAEQAVTSPPRRMQIWALRRNGQEFPAEVSFSGWQEEQERLVGMIVRDVTDRHASEARLCELASLDMLTRLASRSAFMDQLTQLTQAAVPFTLLMADLDGFKEVNDMLGHAAGDALLCHVAEQIRTVCRHAILAARPGGDEFVVLLPESGQAATLTAEALIAAIQRPFNYQDSPVTVGASVGIAAYPQHARDASAIMSAADLALYQAKAAGKGCSVQFLPVFREAEQQRRRLERELEVAVRQQQFVLFYQPQYCAQSDDLIGCEALLRWQHPVRGLLLPDAFMGMLMKSSLSITLGEWVLRSALHQVSQWRRCYPGLHVSINLFPRQLDDIRLDRLLGELTQNDASFVHFEVDESLFTSLVQEVPARFHALRRTGARFIIDHYGRTLGAVNLLQYDFIAGLKIDKSLTAQLAESSRIRMMFSALAALGRSLDLRVLAEGIESPAQRALVNEAQCDILQGHALSQPLSPDEFERLLTARGAA